MDDQSVASRGFTYFIQGCDGGPVKIGFALDPEKRLGYLQCGSPVRLVLLGAIEGNHERVLHKKFASIRQHNEWFHPDKELADFISESCPGSKVLRFSHQARARKSWAPAISITPNGKYALARWRDEDGKLRARSLGLASRRTEVKQRRDDLFAELVLESQNFRSKSLHKTDAAPENAS